MPYFEIDNENHMPASSEIAIYYRYIMLHIVKTFSTTLDRSSNWILNSLTTCVPYLIHYASFHWLDNYILIMKCKEKLLSIYVVFSSLFIIPPY